MLEREQAESGEGQSMKQTLSEAGEGMEVGNSGKRLYHAGDTARLEWERLSEHGYPTPGISTQKSAAAFGERNLQHGNATLECGRKTLLRAINGCSWTR